MPIKRFTASFSGVCNECSEVFEEEDRVGYNEDDDLICGECCDDADAREEEETQGWKGDWKGRMS